MARRKAARASKQFLPAHGHTQSGSLTPVTSTLASGLSRASTLLRNRTRRGNTSSSSNGSATLVAGDEPGKRPTSGFGFWRIPSVDSTVAEEREDRRRKGWLEQGEMDEADVSSYKFLFLTPGLMASLIDRAQLSTTTFTGIIQPTTNHLPPIIHKPIRVFFSHTLDGLSYPGTSSNRLAIARNSTRNRNRTRAPAQTRTISLRPAPKAVTPQHACVNEQQRARAPRTYGQPFKRMERTTLVRRGQWRRI